MNQLIQSVNLQGDIYGMLLTSPVESDGGGDDGDPAQDGDDGQNHGVAAEAARSVDVALLQTVPGLNEKNNDQNFTRQTSVFNQ